MTDNHTMKTIARNVVQLLYAIKLQSEFDDDNEGFELLLKTEKYQIIKNQLRIILGE